MGSVDTKNIPYTQIDDVLFQYLTSPNFSNTFININDDKLAILEKASFTSTIDTCLLYTSDAADDLTTV